MIRAVLLCTSLLGCGAEVDTNYDAGADEALGTVSQALSSFTIPLWPGGVIPYAFTSEVTPTEKARIQARMADWATATAGFIAWSDCSSGGCPSIYLKIRQNTATDDDNMACSPLGHASGATFRFIPGTTEDSTLLHELGHCIGLSHEHQRLDRDRFLVEGSFVYDQGTAATSRLPLLGNYDYDSVMHYASYTDGESNTGTLRWKDQLGNSFARFTSGEISTHDASRVIQYYAREYQPNWDFFKSFATLPANADTLPNPYLASGVEAVGTPAIAYSNGVTHTFVRGSDDNMYWKTGTGTGGWASLGCCAGSDPAAVATASDQIDLAFIGASSGKLIRTRYSAGVWGGWFYVQDGMPSGGIRLALDGSGYIGPGIASRGTNLVDFFVVRAADGLLSTISHNGSWSGWQTLSGPSYYVRARPAAAALSSTEVAVAYTKSTTAHVGLVGFSGNSVSTFSITGSLGNVVTNAPPAITKRNNASARYRILMVSRTYGWLANRFENDSGSIYIGGIPKSGTGVSAAATGSFSADMVMNGTEQLGCDTTCIANQPDPGGVVQPGGIWFRRFE
jgi:hypothetical protein